jgi:dolichyl-diphosphooligosaccharide--protein glycosyltransferase
MEEDNNNDNNKVVEAEIISDSKENEEKEESREPEEKAEEKEEKEDKKEEKKEKREEKKRKAGLFAKKHEEEKEEDEVEVRIDWKKAAKMFDARWLWVLLILIPIILTSTIRIQPNTLAITQDWATGTVYNVYKNSIAQQVSSMYPNLPDANKQTLVDQQFKAYLKSNSAAIDNQIKQTAAYFKSKMQYDVNGASYTYLGDLDSYYFLRYAENYLKTGKQADEIRNGTNWDNHMVAPIGAAMTPTMHPYSIAYLYNFLRLFNKNITPMQASFYVPLVCAVIAAIAAFMIGKRLAGNMAGLSASVLVSVNTMFLSRTMGSDTDVYNLMFPLLIVWMIIEAFEAEKNRNKAIFAGLAGLLIGIFSLAWMGWWYIFDFMIAAIGAYIIYLLAETRRKDKHEKDNAKKQLKNTIVITIILFASSALFVSLFSSIQGFTAFINGPFGVMNLKEVVHQTLWPNVYLTVAELNPGSFSTTLSVMGGWLFFLLAIIGAAFAFLKKDKNGHYDIRTAVLLLIWFAGTSYATLKGVRFSLLVVPAFAIAAGVALGNIFDITRKFATRELKIHKYISYAILLVLLGLVLMPQIKAGYAAGKSYVPSMNDAWYNSLTKIRNESAPNAIINSWWDFGHWFKYVANRAVTADGASQNSPQAYWLGRILVTNDEDEAIAVLRMLDCGSNTAFEIIDKTNNDTAKSIEMLRKAIMMNRTDAEAYLSQYLGKSDVEAVLNNIDCSPPEDYFITSGDMVSKAGVWAHFGLWDFNKAKLMVKVKTSNLSYATELMKQMNYSNAQIEQTIYNISSLASSRDEENWVSPWPGYFATNGYCQDQNNTNITLCSNNLQGQNVMVLINWTNMSAVSAGLYTGQNLLKPYSFVYYENGSLIEEKYEKPDFPYSIILTPNHETVIASPELSESVFTRLFFMNGAGLNHFILFDHETEITGSEIYVWNVSWA